MNWDLSRLYASFDDPAFAADLAAANDGAARAQAALSAIPAGEGEAAALRELIEMLQALSDLAGKLRLMVQLTLSADAGCEAALEPRARVMELNERMELLESALTAWVGSNPRIEALCEADELLGAHRRYFQKLRSRAAHLIDPAVEPAVRRMQQSGGARVVPSARRALRGIDGIRRIGRRIARTAADCRARYGQRSPPRRARGRLPRGALRLSKDRDGDGRLPERRRRRGRLDGAAAKLRFRARLVAGCGAHGSRYAGRADSDHARPGCRCFAAISG